MYLVFEFYWYYPDGGMNDFDSCHDTLEAAKSACSSSKAECIQILDTATMEVHEKNDGGEWASEVIAP